MTMETIGSVETGRVHQHNGTILVQAAECIGVKVSDKDINYFKTASRLAAYIDDLLDTHGVAPDVDALIDKPEDYMQNYLSTSDIQMVSEVIADLSDERRTEWLKAKDLPEHSKNKRDATTIHELKDALVDEAMLFKSIFSLDQIGHDAAARQSFNAWLTHFSKGGYFVDAAVDLQSDYVASRISVEPTIGHRVKLSGWASLELGAALRMTRSSRFLFELGKTASATLLEARRA